MTVIPCKDRNSCEVKAAFAAIIQYQLRFAMAAQGDPATLSELARTHLTIDAQAFMFQQLHPSWLA